MFPKTLCDHVEFHLLLWAGMFRMASEVLSWPRETVRAQRRYNREKEAPV